MHVEEGESQLGIPVREIKGIGEKTEKLLAKLDIETVDQLVHHYPRCYTTYPEPISISEIKTGQRCSIEAEIPDSSKDCSEVKTLYRAYRRCQRTAFCALV